MNNYNKQADAAGYPKCEMFQVKPNWLTKCVNTRTQSPHDGGITTGLGDGSVRFVGASVSPDTWAAACDPRDGVPLGTDW